MAILAITIVIFIPSLNNDFTDKDDQEFLIDEPLVRTLSFKNVKELVLKYPEEPISHILWIIEYQFFNQNSFGYHVSNLLIHLANIALLFYLLALFTGNIIFLGLVTLVFAIHPMHVEPVAWISGKTHLLFGFFYFSALITYYKYLTGGFSKKYYGITVVLLFLALFAYAPALSFIPVVLLMDYYLGRKLNWSVLFDKIPFLVLSAIYLIIIVQLRHDEQVQFEDYSILERVQVSCYAVLFYLYKFLIPVNLSSFYPYIERVGGQLPDIFGFYPIVVVGLAGAILYSLKYTRYIFLGLAFYFITIFPMLRWIPVTHPYMMADRYTYIPYLAIAGLIAGGVIYLKKKNLSKFFQQGIFIVLALWSTLLAYLSWQRTEVWKSTETLWTDVIESYPNVATAWYNRGLFYDISQQHSLALSDYSATIDRDSTYYKAYFNRSRLYNLKREYKLALNDINKAMALNPGQPQVYVSRGNIYYNMEEYQYAIENFDVGLRLDPDNYKLYYNRANAYYIRGELITALKDYNRALELNPEFVEAYINRSIVHDELDEKKSALSDAIKAAQLGFEIDPEYLDRLKYEAQAQNQEVSD